MERRDASHGELRDSSALDASAGQLSIEDARLFARAADGDHDAVSTVWRANRRWLA
ncbi:MAG: hypothetical protein ACKO0W_08405 [Planctomycetota bacterium]